jgi:hypothetical protein
LQKIIRVSYQGAIYLLIRPFQIGDIFVIQRLSRQATKLTTIQALLHPYSALRAALTAALFWNDAKITTYVLQRREHGLARVGFLQAQKRHGRPEADILLLAPALDTTWGHPVIWQKLLAYYINEAPQSQVTRVYADVPDQPLLVNTFSQVGFRVYARQTIWRLADYTLATLPIAHTQSIRPQNRQDEWALQRLYDRVTPSTVQQVKGFDADLAVKSPILDWWHAGTQKSYVLEEKGEIQGCVQVAYGPSGVWVQLWADMHQPDTHFVHDLIRFGLTVIRQDQVQLPIYVGVNEYDGALGTILSDYGFAPFTDRARMVKQLVQWVKTVVPTLAPVALEAVGEVAPTPYTDALH